MIRSVAFVILSLLFFSVSFAQSGDTLTIVEYDTVVVTHPPVVLKRHVLFLKQKEKDTSSKEFIIGASVGLNFFNSIYNTCPIYYSYVDEVKKSGQRSPGFNATLYAYRQLGKRFYYNAQLRYSLYTERFNYDGVSALNQYSQLGAGVSLLYELTKSTKNRLFVGLGGNLHYLLSEQGKTITIFKTTSTADVGDFRVYNKLLGGVDVSLHWMRPLNERVYLLVNPELAFEITSFTSYSEYYLQNRFLYALNLGALRKF